MELSDEGLERFFSFMSPLLDERQRRLMAGAMSRVLGRGGQKAVVAASRMSSRTVLDGAKEFDAGAGPSDRVRRPGAGRPGSSTSTPPC